MGVKSFQSTQLFIEYFLDFFAPFLLRRFLRKLFDILLLAIATQLVLYGFYLLLQEMLALLLVDIGTGFRLDIGFYFEELSFFAQGGIEGESALFYRRNIEKLLFLLRRKRNIRAQEIDEIEHIAHVTQSKNEFSRWFGHRLQHIERNVFQCIEQCFEFLVVFLGHDFGLERDISGNVRKIGRNLIKVKTLFPL